MIITIIVRETYFVACATLNLHYVWYRVKYTFKTMVVSKSTHE